ncbi:MAG TPA: endonuclease [Dehalococcoidia bacterium]|nr:endonuclease [Dehalococcoidia bacterium]
MQPTTKAKPRKGKMSPPAEWLAARPLLTGLGITALSVLFGMQLLRVLVPGIFWILGARMDWGAIELGAIGLLIFLTAFLAAPLGRLLGNHRLIIVSGGGLALVRLLIQFWWGEPLFNLCLAIAGTIFFIIFLPACLENSRAQGAFAISHFALGLLVGLALDTAISGAFKTYDTAWRVELLPLLVTVLLVAAQLVLLSYATVTSARLTPSPAASGTSTWKALTWLAVGPFLFLELVVLQNIPRLAALTDWSLPLAFMLILLAQLAGLAMATYFLSKVRHNLWLWALGCGAGLIAVLAPGYQDSAELTALLLLVGQILASTLIVIILMGITASAAKRQQPTISLGNGAGMVLLLSFILAYYAVYDISLPYSNTLLEPVAGGIIATCAVAGTAILPKQVLPRLKLWTVPALSLLLLIVPLSMAITWQPPAAVAGKGFPIRIMTYNLHNGFNTDGHLNMETIARVIERSAPDIVALQEVSRGWVVSGRLDMLTWLSQRLHMPYVFAPTADPLWGNAILSRYPVMAYSRFDLPPADLFIRRGFVAALVDLGNGDKLKVIATHLHHLEGDSDIRKEQAGTIVKFLDDVGHNRVVLLGDLNAEPSDPEMVLLKEAGLLDTCETMNPYLACTFPSENPRKRIDYIWISRDLVLQDIEVPFSTASDHLPVIAVISEQASRRLNHGYY